MQINKLYSDIRLIGMGSLLTPFINQNSASRVQMATQQTSQTTIPAKPDIPFILHGMEKQMGDYTMNVVMPCDATIVRVIHLYNRGAGSYGRSKHMAVIYQDFDTNKYGILDVPTFRSTQDTFGYPLTLTKIGRSLRTGMVIRKDEVIAKTPSIHEGGIYSSTLNLNVLNISLPHVIEDGFLISDEKAEEAAPYYVVKHRIDYGKRSFPVMLYGKDGKRKPIPDIGECVREDGLLAATRKFDELFDAISMHGDNITEVDTVHDRKIYVEPGAEVIDVRVINTTVDKRGKPTTPQGMEEQAVKYCDQHIAYSDSLIEWYNNIKKDDPTARFEPHLQRSISDAYGANPNAPDRRRVRGQYRAKVGSVKRVTKKQPLNEYTVEITLGYRKPLQPGAKLANMHGCKGVVCAILPKDQMPVDEFGNIADICMFSRSVVARMNTGQLAEQHVNAVRRDVNDDIRKMAAEGQDEQAWQYLMSYYEIVSPSLYSKLSKYGLQSARGKKHLKGVVDGDIYIHIMADGSWSIDDLYMKSMQFRRPNKGRIRVIGFDGKHRWTRHSMLIGAEQFMVLEKTSHKPFACSTASRNNFGLPATTNNATKHATPVNHNPPRWLGESEVRGISANVGGDFVAELLDYTNNPESAESIVKTIFGADNPALVQKAVNRTDIPRGNDRSSGMINHIFDCIGIGLFESDITVDV